jgi:DNA-binding NarL/FixJ family response regulator
MEAVIKKTKRNLSDHQSISHIAIIEDDPLIQESLVSILGVHPGLNIAHMTDSVESFLHNIKKSNAHPDIILLDINLKGMSGLDGIPFLREQLPEVDVIVLTTFEDRDKIFKALCAGACSYLSKQTSIKDILHAVLTVKNGGSYMSPSIARKIVNHFAPAPEEKALSPRQQQIVQAIVDGKSYKQIAADLFLSIDTIRSHIKKIYRALEVNSKAELIKKTTRRKY